MLLPFDVKYNDIKSLDIKSRDVERSVTLSAMPGPPAEEPVGRALSTTAKAVTRAFNAELRKAGGSQSDWLILLALKQQRRRAQQEIATAVGIEGPTVTHHLDGLEKAGLIERSRDPDDRRVVRVELTAAGDERFHRLARAANAFDRRLRTGLADDEVAALRAILAKLRENVA